MGSTYDYEFRKKKKKPRGMLFSNISANIAGAIFTFNISGGWEGLVQL
jgi:hypothetical protein